MNPNTVFLFDLDGVLIRPGGYRAALRITIETAYRRMGLEDAAPASAVFDGLEAQGITNEWDMAALCVALALEQVMAHHSLKSIEENLDAVFQAVRALQIGHLKIDYAALKALSGFVGQRMTPSAALLAAARRGKKTFLDGLLAFPGVLDELFGHVDDVARAPLTRLHQLYVVGSHEFARAYHLSAEFETPSCLELHDRSLLDSERRDALLAKWRAGELGLVAFTARPSLPPRECVNGQIGFTAEAEMATRLNGLQDVPLIGYGRLRYLAEELGQSTEHFIKPEPGHALAAILAGLTRQEWPSLVAADVILKKGELPEGLWLPGYLAVHVFEDSPIGVRAAFQAARLLRGQGIQVELHAWGIAENPDKVKALQAEGAHVFADVNQALDEACG